MKHTIILLSVVFLSACSAMPKQAAYTASANLACSNTDYKDQRFSGSTDDSCGYQLVGRIGGGVRTPILDKQDKGAPVGSQSRPDDTVEVEAGYVKHGDMDFNGLWQGTPDTGTVKADGFILGLVYTRRINNAVDLFGGVGAHRWDVRENEVFGGTPEYHDASGTSPYFQLGGRYWITGNTAVRASWQRFSNVGENDVTGKGDIDAWLLGLDYRF